MMRLLARPAIAQPNFFKQKSYDGFTLIEMIIVLFFAVILITVLFSLYDWHSKYYYYQQALVRVTGSSRASVGTLQDYLSQANQILPSASVNGMSYTSATSSLVAQLPAIDSSGAALPGKYDKVAFYSTGSSFYLQLEPDPASSRAKLNKILSDSLQSVAFSYNNASSSLVTQVTVDFLSQLQVKSQIVSSNLKQNIYLFNY